jgi:hypothetical protein
MNQGPSRKQWKSWSCAQMKFHTRYINCRARLDVTATRSAWTRDLLPSEGLRTVSTSSGVKIGHLLSLHHRKITLFPFALRATEDGGRKVVEVAICEELS